MSFLHQKSCECVKSELDLFSLPPTQTSIESGKWVQYKPVSSLTDDSPIEFVIPGNGEEYSDLAQTLLHIEATILKADGTKLDENATKTVGPINNWLHSLFSQVDLYLNHKLVSAQNNTYAYRAYLENLLNYGASAKRSHLTSVLYNEDSAGHMDDCEEANDGLKYRRAFVSKSKCVDMVGHLHLDLCNQDKFLLNGVEMRLRLIRARDTFTIMSKSEPVKVSIKDASLYIRRCKINPSILLAHAKILDTSTAKYPITRVEVKSVTLPSGIRNKTLDSVFLGQLPKRLIIGFVTNAAFNGDLKKNPFNFQHFNLNYLSLYMDGEQVPSKPLQPIFTGTGAPKYIMAYHTLFSGTGIQFTDAGNDISRDDYPEGFCLMAFDLTPDMSSGETTHWNLVRNGNLRIELGFSSALTETVNCIIYAEMDNVIEIDRNRDVTVDFTG